MKYMAARHPFYQVALADNSEEIEADFAWIESNVIPHLNDMDPSDVLPYLLQLFSKKAILARESMCFVLNVPPEILMCILLQTNAQWIGRVAQTCKYMKIVCDDDGLWKMMCQQ
jgi:hypothetical protein